MSWNGNTTSAQASTAPDPALKPGGLILSIKERTVKYGIVGFQESFSETQRGIPGSLCLVGKGGTFPRLISRERETQVRASRKMSSRTPCESGFAIPKLYLYLKVWKRRILQQNVPILPTNGPTDFFINAFFFLSGNLFPPLCTRSKILSTFTQLQPLCHCQQPCDKRQHQVTTLPTPRLRHSTQQQDESHFLPYK